MTKRFEDFTKEERELLIDAIWLRQRNFIAGDKRFKEYGKLLDEFMEDSNYVPGKFR